jgi:hypothetical protein
MPKKLNRIRTEKYAAPSELARQMLVIIRVTESDEERASAKSIGNAESIFSHQTDRFLPTLPRFSELVLDGIIAGFA